MKILRWLLPVLLLLEGASGCRPTGHLVPERETLRGIHGLYLVVENLDGQVEREGLTTEQLEADIKQRLAGAGVQLLTNPQWIKLPGNPYLHVNVTTARAGNQGHSYAIQVSLQQIVELHRSPEMRVIAKTWELASVGFAGPYKVRSILADVGEAVDQFIKDLLAANPR